MNIQFSNISKMYSSLRIRVAVACAVLFCFPAVANAAIEITVIQVKKTGLTMASTA